jgi:hypothetical protein
MNILPSLLSVPYICDFMPLSLRSLFTSKVLISSFFGYWIKSFFPNSYLLGIGFDTTWTIPRLQCYLWPPMLPNHQCYTLIPELPRKVQYWVRTKAHAALDFLLLRLTNGPGRPQPVTGIASCNRSFIWWGFLIVLELFQSLHHKHTWVWSCQDLPGVRFYQPNTEFQDKLLCLLPCLMPQEIGSHITLYCPWLSYLGWY